jgi:protein-S-isoprenylcysteine O-methyltransferase
MSAQPTEQDVQDGFEERLRQRKEQLENHPLNTVPKAKANNSDGALPNTPLTASTISFLLGWVFSLGVLTFLRGGFGSWWNSYQLGFFVAAWSGFHWGEFAVTAGWNLEKCSVDCA